MTDVAPGVKILPLASYVPGTHTPQFMFQCPGCGFAHWFNEKVWTWNKDVRRPTVAPSILVHGPHRCHSYVQGGQIKFLGDCTHELRGQTVPLPDWSTGTDRG